MSTESNSTTAVAGMLIILAITACLLAAGCGTGPGEAVSGFMKAKEGAEEQAASSMCYDKYAFQQISDALGTGARASDVTIISVSEEGARRLRLKGYDPGTLETVADRLAGKRAEVEARFKPLIDAAGSDLADVQRELAAAQAQLVYSKETYGRNMPQYYAEQRRIAAIQPRVAAAQSKFDTLNAQKDAELQTLEATAAKEYEADRAKRDKALAANSASTRAAVVEVRLRGGKSAGAGQFVLAYSGGTWKLFSYDPKK